MFVFVFGWLFVVCCLLLVVGFFGVGSWLVVGGCHVVCGVLCLGFCVPCSLLGVRCVLVVGCWFVFGVLWLLVARVLVACCLFVVCLLVVGCMLFVVCCVVFVICCLLCDVCWML